MIQLIPTKIENGRIVEDTATIRVEPIRISATSKTLAGKNGSQTVGSFKILLQPDTDITIGHKILIDGKKWEILSLYKPNDAEGNPHHIQVIV